MSGRDERPQRALTFGDVWPSIEEKLKRESERRSWSDIEYTYYKMVAKYELNVILRDGFVATDEREVSRWQRAGERVRRVWSR